MNMILRAAVVNFARQAARKHIAGNPRLDPKIGWSLMRDRQVPVAPKVLALGIGAAVTAILLALEMPLETIVGFIMPVVGVPLFGLFDGAEMILCPLLVAGMALPFVAPIPVRRSSASQRQKHLPVS